MHSDERIEDLANELGIDSGTSSNSADRMRKVAEAVGMNDFNSLHDVDKLEEKLKEQAREKRTNEDLKRREDLRNNTGSVKRNSGRNAYLNKLNNKNYYKNQSDELKNRLENAKKERQMSNKRNADGTFSDKTREEKKEDKKNLADAKKDLRNNKINNMKSKAFAATHPIEAQKMKLKGAWKKLPLKVKLIIIGIGISFISSAIFIVVLFAPLIQLGIVRSDTSGSSSNSSLSNYTQTSSNISYWWPIGSSETRTENGVTYADGEPVGYAVKSEFGTRNDPYTGNKASHSGLDIAPLSGDYGTVNVIAAKSGTVIRVNNDPTCESNSLNESCNGSGYGNYVEIEHQDGNTTLYGHMHKNTITVSVGDIVDQGQVIGKVGSSGRSTGMHLHFEVRENSIAVNPLNYISENNERPSATSNNVLMGSDSKQTICLTLKDNGYSNEAVAGLMGNMEAESGFRPNAVNELGCVGIVQWCFSLANELKTTYGDSWSNIDSQLDFLLHELNNDFPSVNSYLHGNHTAEEHAYYFCMNFERPGASHCNNGKRQNFAKNNYEYIKNNCQ